MPFASLVVVGSLLTEKYQQCLDIITDRLMEHYILNIKNKDEGYNKRLEDLVGIMERYPLIVSIGGIQVTFGNIVRLVLAFLASKCVAIAVSQWEYINVSTR